MARACEVMTKDVVVVSPGTSTREIARLLLGHGISAVPVVDAAGAPLGMVSEGDLIGRAEGERQARRDWWLTLLAEGESLAPEFLTSLRDGEQTAQDVMTAPVVTIDENMEVSEIARLLAAYRIKRVPVVRDGRIAGIVSRADVLRAFAAEQAGEAMAKHRPNAQGRLSEAISHLDERLFGRTHAGKEQASGQARPASAEPRVTGADLRALVADFEHQKAGHQDEARRAIAEGHRRKVEDLITHHIADQQWQDLLHRAREAAQQGETEVMLLRFPSDLCSDGGRAINVSEPDWPATLRGEAAEIYLRWQRDLKPCGFHMTARVLDFPGGVPGDIGLSLVWGK
jgi:CBS domain-containing protein